MEKKFFKWDDVKNQCPPPHYIKPNSTVTVEIGGGEIIKASGICLFPKEDPTLTSRRQVNHFHSILLLEDVVFALNVIWNLARVIQPEKGWKDMVSVKTETRVFHPIEIGHSYAFYVYIEPLKGNFKKAKLRIVSDEEIEYISAVTTVIVK